MLPPGLGSAEDGRGRPLVHSPTLRNRGSPLRAALAPLCHHRFVVTLDPPRKLMRLEAPALWTRHTESFHDPLFCRCSQARDLSARRSGLYPRAAGPNPAPRGGSRSRPAAGRCARGRPGDTASIPQRLPTFPAPQETERKPRGQQGRGSRIGQRKRWRRPTESPTGGPATGVEGRSPNGHLWASRGLRSASTR
jgi:hypothetical protein